MSNSNGRMMGKVALVTGSTSGIGEASAIRLAEDGAAGIVITGRDQSRGADVAERLADITEAIFVPTELGEPEAVRALIESCDTHFGRLDVLVNAAGLSTRGSIEDTTPELFDRLMAVNVRAPLLLMQGAIRIMRREGIEGVIVNIGSVASHGSDTFLTPYSASKAALSALTKNVAYSVLWDRIRCNVIDIGWTDTPTEDAIQRRYHTDGADWLADAEAQHPFGRLLKPAEIAGVVSFLASSESGVMTGSVIDFTQSVMGGGPATYPPQPEATG